MLFERVNADVLCLQEVFVSMVPLIESIGYTVSFVPFSLKSSDNKYEECGIAIATKTSHVSHKQYCYHKPSNTIVRFDREHIHETVANAVLVAEILNDGMPYTIATTHFTWTPNGNIPNDSQKADLPKFLSAIKKLPPHVMTGDFNIPRGHNELYPLLTEHYTDAVPTTYKSSLDKAFHRHKDEPELVHLFTDYMVDYIFTQTPYRAENVRLEFGASDHAAVIADISKT